MNVNILENHSKLLRLALLKPPMKPVLVLVVAAESARRGNIVAYATSRNKLEALPSSH